MVNNQKRYRSVFEAAEVDYIRIELALYNKLFDEEDWQATINLKCIVSVGALEYCSRELEVDISREENIFFLRDGWGVEQKGGFWKKGAYKWQAFVDEVLLGEHSFFINDVGLVDSLENPYLEVESLRLYNSDING